MTTNRPLMTRWSTALALALALVVVACGTQATTTLTEAPASEEPPTEDPVADDSAPVVLPEQRPKNRPGGSRQPVALFDQVQITDRESTVFTVGVESCNGDPTHTVLESEAEVRVSAESWIPSGNDRDGCLDGIRVTLDEPLGDRPIIDTLSGATMPVLTDEILNAPNLVTELECAEDSADASHGCLASFQILSQSYTLTCLAVASDGIATWQFAAGALNGRPIDVFPIKSVGVNIMVAVDVPSGNCLTDSGVDQPWSVAVVNGADLNQRSRFLCSLADLSDEQRATERCERLSSE